MTKLDNGDALRRGVWESPEDRGRLAVYADWLIEHGEATRGEFMQLSLLEKPSAAQEKRREALRKKHRGEWLGEARKHVWTWEESEDSPGFVAKVKCALKKLAPGFEQVRALGPRLLVEVNPVLGVKDRAAFAALPLGRLYGLGIYEADNGWVTDKLVLAIAPKLEGLRHLELSCFADRLSVEAWRTMLASVTTIDELEFSTYGTVDPYLEAVLDGPHVKTLRFLTIDTPNDAALARRAEKAFAKRTLELT